MVGKIASFKFQRVRASKRHVHKEDSIVSWIPNISIKSFIVRATVFVMLSLTALYFRTELAFSNVAYSTVSLTVRPVIVAYNYVNDWLKNTFGVFTSHKLLHAEIAQLKQQNANLMHWQEFAKQSQAELLTLRKLLNVTLPATYQTVAVSVLSKVSSGFHQSLLINTAPGLNNNQAVLNEHGLLGRIMSVGPQASQIMLITDSSSRVPVRVENSDVEAIVLGNNSMFLDVNIKMHDEDVKVGQRLMSSGFGNVFPKGVPVAVIVSARNGTVKAKPFFPNGQMEIIKVVTHHSQGSSFYQRS